MNANSSGASLSPEKRALLEAMLHKKAAAKGAAAPGAAESPAQAAQPLSFAQESIWFFDQLVPNSPLYNIPQAWRLTGRLDVGVLRQAFTAITARHHILRAQFSSVDGKPVQTVSAASEFQMPVTDLSDLKPLDRETRVRSALDEEATRPFNLQRDMLLRASVLRLGPEEHVLLLSMHHIVADMWSLELLYREVSALYTALMENKAPPLPPLSTQYSDFAAAQRREARDAALDRQLGYWKAQLAGELPVLSLPTVKSTGQEASFRGSRQLITLPASLSNSLRDLSRHEGTTLYVTLLTAFQTLLHRYSGQPAVLVGSPIGARQQSAAEELIGLFLNMVVLRANFAGNPSFRDLLHQVRNTVFKAFENQYVPLERLADELKVARSAGRSPIFQTVFQFLAAPVSSPRFPGVDATSLPMETGTAKFDLTLTLADGPSGLTGDLEYNTDLFDTEAVSRFLAHYEVLLEAIVTDPAQPIGSLPLLTRTEECLLLARWNNTAIPYPRNVSLENLFEKQAATSPNAIALDSEQGQLTYLELNARANQLGHYLQQYGVGPDAMVGVCLDRSLQLIISLLGIAKAGGAYVPLDPMYPVERIEYMVKDTAAPVIITTRDHAARLFQAYSGTLICLDEEAATIAQFPERTPESSVTAENLAYVIYTSGSTGRPKGVCVPQRAVTRLVKGSNYVSFKPDDVFLLFAPISFDASTFEVWGPLLNGAKLVISPPELTSLENLGKFIRDRGITTLWLTAGLFNQMVDLHIESLKGVHTLLAGGDILSPTHVLKALRELPGTQLVNGYGPTENTTFTCCYAVPRDWPGDQPVPIGSPISNTQVYILDQYRQLAPIGVVGELYAGGDGLARGYLNAPELTAEKFVANPLDPKSNGCLYRTGDLARWLPDGTIAFLGRVDHQLKIRGYRVEPGEIEHALSGHPAVQQAAVVARADSASTKYLLAYVTLHSGQSASPGELRSFLESTLPRHMVPSQFMVLESFPLTANGKIDRAALPSPEECVTAPATYVAPRTPEESILSEVWTQVLGRQQISVHDNFFESGGHSLLATRVISRIAKTAGAELTLRDLFEHPTIASLAQVLARVRGPGTQVQRIAPIISRHSGLPLPVSFAQQRLWFIDQVQPNHPVYNVPQAYRLRGALDIPALQKSLRALVERHEILRTIYMSADGKPVQKIMAEFELTLPIVDLRETPEPEKELLKRLNEEARRPFDLQSDLMIRAALFQLESEYVLFLNLHHIAFDEWSQQILQAELTHFYQAFSQGNSPSLTPLPIQYADFACWQQDRAVAGAYSADIVYWMQRLSGCDLGVALTSDRPRPAVRTATGNLESRVLSRTLTADLRRLAQRKGVTLYGLLLAAFNVLLYRYTSRDQLVVATPVAGRAQFETEQLLGFFVNMLAIRGDLSGDPSFDEVVERVRQANLEALSHQQAPFEKVIESLHPERSPQQPLFEVAFAVQNHPGPFQLPGLEVTAIPLHTGTAKFDLTVVVEDRGSDLATLIEYDTDLFFPDTARRLLEHFQVLLETVVAHPEQKIAFAPILTSVERALIVEEWNRTTTNYPRQQTIHELFSAQAKKTPNSIAVSYGDQALTYAELDAHSNQLAAYLRNLGVEPDVLVGTFLDRSVELVIAWLAILKAGGAYVPLDLEFPPERIDFVLQDTKMLALITKHAFIPRIPATATRVIQIDSDWHEVRKCPGGAPPPNQASPENLAYVICTSGSTGQPKGVAIPHRAIARLLFETNYIQLDSSHRIAQASNSAFDAATFEVWGALLFGGRLLGVQKDVILSPAEFASFLERESITAMFLTTALFNQVAAEVPTAFRSATYVMVGGDAVDPRAAARVLQNGPPKHLLNAYGPTETTTFAAYYEIKSVPHDARSIPIGRPISNTTLYVLDPRLEPVPIGVPGELYIGGDGLARGYYNRPELTAQKFIKNPFDSSKTSRLYKTGDLVRQLPTGDIDFMGRLDNQVKIRGFRIELGEIEALLNQAPGVRDSIVIAREHGPGEKRLAAYFMATGNAAPTAGTLRNFLKHKLPGYMIPSSFVEMSAFPLTPNGKIDRRALPVPGADVPVKTTCQPRSELEQQLFEVWRQVLGHDNFGIRDDFFEIGGHSLLAVRLVAQTEAAIGIKLPLPILFQAATIEKLAEALSHNAPFSPGSCLVKIQPVGTRPPIFWPHTLGGGAGGGLFTYRKLAMLLGSDQPSYGFVAPAQPFTTIETMAAHYIQEMKRVQPTGPYYLGGYCFAGVVAYEMARQLAEAGEEVALLALLDSSPPDIARGRRRLSFKLALHVLCTLPFWAGDLIALDSEELRKTIKWKTAIWGARIRRFFRNKQETPNGQHNSNAEQLEELVDMSAYPQEYRRFALVHWNALLHYSPQPYKGKAILFKGEDRYLLRLDGVDSWRKLIRGGVEVKNIMGKHDGILAEPCVYMLATRLTECLQRTRK